MANKLQDLIDKIENPELRAQIREAAGELTKQKKFGLVFEEHLPECTPLYEIPVRKGVKVSLRNGKTNDTYTVLKVEAGKALCKPKDSGTAVEFSVDDLVTTAELGDPIYPCLKPLGEVCNAPDSELWHTLIEADNYHALQLLEYLYAGKVSCIYIDPPYNTGAKDWKYNNDYVDGADEYRHSKWLSFMKKRLELAKKLLKEGKQPKVILGFASKDDCFYEEEYKALGLEVEVMTADSSYGGKGFVTNAKLFTDKDYDYIYTCGPIPMLKAIYDNSEVSGQFSFEERMGCGFGACMGCSCKTKYGNKRICKDGPVLVKEEIIW